MAAYLPESDSEDELPPGWEERATLQGEVYYASHTTTTTQWEHPRTGRRKEVGESLPFGWERQVLPDRKVVYVDLVNKKTTFTDPRLAFARETVTRGTSFRQKFDASSTALQVAHGRDLTGKVALVTGANSGVGLAVCRALALQGCRVVLACRSESRATAALATLRRERGSVEVEHLTLDLASLGEVRQAARRFLLHHTRLDFLVLNAATFPQHHSTTEDGLEVMMQVNFLSHLYLASLLRRALAAAPAARVAVLASESHRQAELRRPSSLTFNPGPVGFEPQLQYNDSKLCCLMLAPLLARRLAGLGVAALAVHPGNLLPTRLHRHSWLYWALAALARPWTKSCDQAAGSVVQALLAEDLPANTAYINNCFPTQPSATAASPGVQEELWEAAVATLELRMGEGCCTEPL